MQIIGATKTESGRIKSIVASGKTFEHYPKYSIVLQRGTLKELIFRIFTAGKDFEHGYRKDVKVLL